jgi:hypothetical protein
MTMAVMMMTMPTMNTAMALMTQTADGCSNNNNSNNNTQQIQNNNRIATATKQPKRTAGGKLANPARASGLLLGLNHEHIVALAHKRVD